MNTGFFLIKNYTRRNSKWILLTNVSGEVFINASNFDLFIYLAEGIITDIVLFPEEIHCTHTTFIAMRSLQWCSMFSWRNAVNFDI